MSATTFPPGIKVSIEDLLTGKVETKTITDDWLLITHGRVYVDGEQRYSNGTAVVTIKRAKPGEAPR